MSTFPAIDLRNDIRHEYAPSVGYSVSLFADQKQLLLSKYEVVIVQGATVSKKLVFDDPIVSATYTTFNTNERDQALANYNGNSGDKGGIDSSSRLALVVCLRKSAHVYYPDGRQYMISFPFSLNKAMPFESGLILEKEQSLILDVSHPPAFNLAKFLTLVDPIGDFRLVSTSSTTVVSSKEELMAFPNRKGSLSKSTSCLCATYNRNDSTVVLYFVKSSIRVNKRTAGGQLNSSNINHNTNITTGAHNNSNNGNNNGNGNINTGNNHNSNSANANSSIHNNNNSNSGQNNRGIHHSSGSGVNHNNTSINNNNINNSNNSNKYFKRKTSASYSPPGHSRILEDEEFQNSINNNGTGHIGNHNSNANNGGINSHITAPVLSINMEKKRTSTLLSDISSIARMGSDTSTFPSESIKKGQQDSTALLKKDLILTKLDTFLYSEPMTRSDNQVHIISFEDQEALVIVNPSKSQANIYIYRQQPVNVYRYVQSYTLECNSCVPLNDDNGHPGFLVVLLNPTTITLVNPFLDVKSNGISLSKQFPPIASIQSSSGKRVSMVAKNLRKNYEFQLILEPSNELVSTCLKCFRYLSGSNIRESIWIMWCSALTLDDLRDDWNALVIVLLSIIYPFETDMNSSSFSTNEITMLLPKAKILHDTILKELQYSFTDLIPFIVLSLHLIQEETRLDSLNTISQQKLSILLCQLTTWMGWSESWTSYYMIEPSKIDTSIQFLLISIVESPPNLLESLCSLFGTHKIKRYLTFSQLAEEDESIDKVITPKTYCVLRLFELLVSSQYGPNDLVDMMCEYEIDSTIMETYPPGIYLPLKEAILECQERPAFEWTSEALDLVGRKDLSSLLNRNYLLTTSTTSNLNSAGAGDVLQILNSTFEKPENVTAWDGQSEADRISITKLIFDYDRRYFEITTLLHQTKIQTASLGKIDDDIGEYDLVLLQRELATLVAMRTLSIPLGRAALFYGSRMPLMTEKFPIPKFNFNTLISPSMSTIILNRDSINDSMSEWGYFHNGVSSGLSILPDSKGISGLWIIFNKPPDLNSQHAGFLLGLGLNGHLKRLEEWHIYNYLGPKHPLTSVGLLLGMSASLRGTMDNKLTKVLSVHAVALLPQGANDLNVPIIVQTAGLIGIGLLYLESQHRRMSEILLQQVSGSVFQNDIEQIHEGYRLAAGIALGFVNLGKGNDLKGLNDTHVIDKLLAIATSMKDFLTLQELDKSCCGAIIALGFMYLKTNNNTLANKLKVPESERLLDYIRPDLLLLRCLSKNIINWDQIGDSIEWVESEIPQCLMKRYMKNKKGRKTPNVDFELDSDQLGFFNILGGICIAIAVKFASSHNIDARDTLIYFLDMMIVISNKDARNYDQKIAHHCATNIRNLLAICVSIVMCASGDLESFRRLRMLQGDTRKDMMGYGGYMAINMSLGFLFIGGGQYAFSNSNFAIASLITSIYPVFPSNLSSNYGGWEVHLQALRHFWALSIEQRCLIVRDVTTNKPVKVPIELYKVNGEKVTGNSPCLLPCLSDILQIKINSTNHFDVDIDFRLNSEHLEKFKKTLTIYVYRRRNHKILNSTVSRLLQNENQDLQVVNGEVEINEDLVKLGKLSILEKSINEFERKVFLFESTKISSEIDTSTSMFSMFNVIDNKVELQQLCRPKTVQDLWNLKLIFEYSESLVDGMKYIGSKYIDKMKREIEQGITSL